MKKTKLNPIPTEVYRISQLAQASVKAAPKGTNLALYEGLMTMMSGRMLESRGALIPALADAGFDQCDSMRIWQGLAHGAWEVNTILAALNAQIAQERVWRALEVGGYQVKVLDTVGFFRPRLKGCATKHYQSQAGKALPAIGIGLLGAVGVVNGHAGGHASGLGGQQNVTLPCSLVRASGAVRSEEDLMQALASKAAQQLQSHDVLTADRKFSPLVLLKAGCRHLVLRRPKNMTLRRAQLPRYSGHGRRHTHGEIVRPVARHYKGHAIPAIPPDATRSWPAFRTDGSLCEIQAALWQGVVLPQQKDWTKADRQCLANVVWTAVVITHPDYDPEMRFRLPELSLIAAGVLSYVAATVTSPTPNGWWDQRPKPTAGRLRRQLSRVDWREVPSTDMLCKKRSVTAHLPKGFHLVSAQAKVRNRLN